MDAPTPVRPGGPRWLRGTGLPLGGLLVLTLAVCAVPAGATEPSDLCTGNPCVISGGVSLDPGSFLDFGDTTDLRFAGSAVVQLNDAYFRAGSITLQPGARLVGGGTECEGVTLEAVTGAITMQESAGLLSRLELSGTCPGRAELIALPAGNVSIDGVIDASAVGGIYNTGGDITLYGGGATSMRGRLTTRGGGSTGGGGRITIYAEGGDVLVDGTVEVPSAVSGGVIDVIAEIGDVSLDGTFDIRGGFDSGGRLFVTANTGDATLNGNVTGTGTTGNGVYTCSGDPSVEMFVVGDVTIGATIVLNGLGQYCGSGFMYMEIGGSFTQLPGSKISLVGLAKAAAGGIYLQANGGVTLRDIDMSSQDGGGYLDVIPTSGGAVQVLGTINASGPGGGASMGGCDVYVAAKGTIDARGVGGGGSTYLQASETMTILGKLLAGQSNTLVIREGAPFLGGTITPAPDIVVSPGLPDCRPGPSCTPGGSCGDGVVQCGEECDDGAANGTPASSCSTSCIETPPALRIPGGGSRPFDCPYEWSMTLDPGDVVADPIGIPRNKQSCQDNDPTCDFEPAPGLCRLHLWSCLGGADPRLACSAAQVSSATVLSPKANSTKPTEIAARQSLVAALQALGVPVGPGEECTPRYDITIGVGQKALALKTKVTIPGKVDSDSLALTCTP